GGVLAEARQYAEKAAAAEGVIRLIDQIATQEDIPGVGSYFGAHELTPGARDTDAQVRALAEALGRMQSGGVISREEEERFMEMIVGGVQLGGETRLRKNLAVVRDMARAKLETYERALSPEARAYMRRNQALPEFRAEFTGSTNAEDVVVED